MIIKCSFSSSLNTLWLKNGRSSKFSVGRQRGTIAKEVRLVAAAPEERVAIDARARRQPELLAHDRQLRIDLDAHAVERTVVQSAR